MLEKVLALAVAVTVVGHLFFRPQLAQLGRRVDRVVTVVAVVVVVGWLCQLGYFLLTREEGVEGSRGRGVEGSGPDQVAPVAPNLQPQ